ncbi:Tubulin-specific chaperone E [Grifola frondosa]|uniref:Tubulin-specific chaperone E n=1 Tax=Grifola frondosa TaxID=5627 RepID=A0A1C7LYM3_GRIFR|nr:Tubulin-specific chaperone E [Grifola frondosa]
MAKANTELPQVGARLNYSGNLGTIRFVGHVDNTQGIWLGVEWDNPRRGKHDGVKDGRKYFSCIIPNSGSFIRPSPAISYGRSFLTALVAKYVELPHGISERVILGSSGGAIEVEAVGLDKIRGNLCHLERLREVSLDNEGVSSADTPGTIERTCPGIRGLDLSKSLIPSWEVVSHIVSELPNLQRLALNQNRLRPPEPMDFGTLAFLNLTELQLNATMTTWPELRGIISRIPKLQLIESGYNHLRELSSEESASQPQEVNTILKILNLDGNELYSWSGVCASLQPFTALERLIVSSNCIERIDAPVNASTSPLSSLRHATLSFNRLKIWRDIDHIPLWCPALESLTLSGNPLVEDPHLGKNARQFAIAKIPSLLVLDGAAISLKERTDSELFYLSYISKHESSDEAIRNREHLQWKALCEKHGKPDSPLPAGQHRADTLNSRLIGQRL